MEWQFVIMTLGHHEIKPHEAVSELTDIGFVPMDLPQGLEASQPVILPSKRIPEPPGIIAFNKTKLSVPVR